MLVGSKNIDDKKLAAQCTSPAALMAYVYSLIPKQIAHVPEVVNNQKYLVATHVRKLKSLPYARKHSLCSSLLVGVRVCGVCNELYDYEDLIGSVDADIWEVLVSAKR